MADEEVATIVAASSLVVTVDALMVVFPETGVAVGNSTAVVRQAPITIVVLPVVIAKEPTTLSPYTKAIDKIVRANAYVVIETIGTTVEEAMAEPAGSREEPGVAFVDCRAAGDSWASVVVEGTIEHRDHFQVVEYP